MADWQFTLRLDATVKEDVEALRAYVGQQLGKPRAALVDVARVALRRGIDELAEEARRAAAAEKARGRRAAAPTAER